MLSFLRGAEPKRTRTSHLTTFKMENGRSSVSFHNDPSLTSQQASISFAIPPADIGDNLKDNSILIPPFHAHPKQDEIFTVIAGTALFHLGRTKIARPAGSEVVIPRGAIHKFTNASTIESMTLEAKYNPPDFAKEERFFRNLCGYLQDTTSSGTGMLEGASAAQIALFVWEADWPICDLGQYTL